jgi:hypothetical protein
VDAEGVGRDRRLTIERAFGQRHVHLGVALEIGYGLLGVRTRIPVCILLVSLLRSSSADQCCGSTRCKALTRVQAGKNNPSASARLSFGDRRYLGTLETLSKNGDPPTCHPLRLAPNLSLRWPSADNPARPSLPDE